MLFERNRIQPTLAATSANLLIASPADSDYADAEIVASGRH
jgi:hypothetical protein